MKVITFVFIFTILLFPSICHSQDATSLEGWKPYTPSRLEWLALELNASNRVELTIESKYCIDFVPNEKEDAIVIFVRYFPDVERELMNTHVNEVKKIITLIAKNRGWTWLKILENVEMCKSIRNKSEGLR